MVLFEYLNKEIKEKNEEMNDDGKDSDEEIIVPHIGMSKGKSSAVVTHSAMLANKS